MRTDANPVPDQRLGISGGSWHPLVRGASAGAKDSLSFIDGHVSFTRIYWNGVADSHPADYEPPPAYDYNWDGE